MAKRRKGDAPKDLGDALRAGYQPMFMTGREIKKHFAPIDQGYGQTDEEGIWKQKEEYATQRGNWNDSVMGERAAKRSSLKYTGSLKDAMKKKGNITGFISLQHPLDARQRTYDGNTLKLGPTKRGRLLGGHHRVALSAAQFPEMILPVKYFEHFREATGDPDYR